MLVIVIAEKDRDRETRQETDTYRNRALA